MSNLKHLKVVFEWISNTVKFCYSKYKIILYPFKNSSKTWDLNLVNKSSLIEINQKAYYIKLKNV